MSSDNSNSIEIGLKTEVKRQVGLKEWEKDVGIHAQNYLVDAWKAMLSAGMEEQVANMVWDYCLKSPKQLWMKVNSATFGIYSTIGEYVNKKGNKSLAHFTENGHYIGSVAKLGKDPIGYDGNFRLTKERFRLDVTKLATLTQFNGAYSLNILFSPK